ncbi:TPA: DUF3732 domain-containing protein [Vibrio parahaemolyticus]|nr:DUF3732 domain-containing protein [Vibrio parahaemolyticus]EGR3244839.1 DUF3732 domain-containing protein [Vibrio parahaemolyticus]MDF4761143.1 DUF3732 domain-containing protein [Vibrio parahaemolyticus]
MNVHIEQIGVIDKKGACHIVPLKEGVNIITGRSSTGKSALIEIVDYCFGSSDFTIPDGVITKHAEIYFLLLKLENSKLLLGRRNKSTKAFIKEFDSEYLDEHGINLSTFTSHNFLTISNFNKELGCYLGLAVTDTELDVNSALYRKTKKPAPSVRSFMSYMLQHQNLIANKHAVFYRFDEKEKREQAIEHFKIFLGLVDQEYFLVSQKLDRYNTQLRNLERTAPKIDSIRKSIKSKIEFILSQYEVIAGCQLGEFSADKAYRNPSRWLKELQNIEIKINSGSENNNKFLQSKQKERNDKLLKLRSEERKYRELCSSVSAMDMYQDILSHKGAPLEVTEHVTICPLCNVHSDLIEEEANSLSEAVDWLNQELEKTPFVHKSFLSKKERSEEKIKVIRGELRFLDEQIQLVEKQNNELSKRNSINEQLIKIKLKLETYLENLIETTTKDELEQKIESLKKKIKSTKKELDSYKLSEKFEYIESFVNETMNEIGNKFDFERDYKPINLKFSLQNFDIWHEPINEKNKKIFLRSMGSGANWLYTHLALFLSLQALFCKLRETCVIPPILFIDQPTQVYFPNSTSDNNDTFDARNMIGGDINNIRVDDDIKSVERFFREIILFCNKLKKEYNISPQIVIIDHADNLNLDECGEFEDYVRARWRTRGFIDI